ncbi:kinase-like domain-containing protein [Ochromonadaceae sp. CCMP2298]|nr:kinase-like domain-containing protein [Ochromonadaceae sp. CCMP2298]
MLSISFHEDFKEEGLLGSGTFADVFKVRMRSGQDQNSFFAVKKSKRQFRSKRDRDWLMEEVRTMKMLGQAPCPYVVPFIRAWQEESYFYVQMGYAERGTLKELLLHLASPRKKRPLGTVWHIVHDVAAGLQHVHACGYVHLDIKPANLLVTGQGTVQIGDFGMAAVIGSREDGHEGDTRYMADELLNNTERLPSADIFSLGLTLGGGMRVTPRRSLPTDGTLWHTLREGRAPPLPAHRSPALCALVAAAMRPVPAARPAALDLLSAPEAQACSEEVDPTLLSAPNPADQRMPYLSRSVSMQQHSGLAGFVAAGGAGGGTSSKAPTLTLDTDIDYSAIGESVFTPHYTPR